MITLVGFVEDVETAGARMRSNPTLPHGRGSDWGVRWD